MKVRVSSSIHWILIVVGWTTLAFVPIYLCYLFTISSNWLGSVVAGLFAFTIVLGIPIAILWSKQEKGRMDRGIS